jgi:dTDP-4-dehydrorhamnose 3,5-epimerase
LELLYIFSLCPAIAEDRRAARLTGNVIDFAGESLRDNWISISLSAGPVMFRRQAVNELRTGICSRFKALMSLDVDQLGIPDVKVIRVKKFGDARGFFSETYNKKALADAGIGVEFVQDNQSYSKVPGTIRGLHAQGTPFAQDKLVRVTRGRIFDVAVDIRPNSPTFGKWAATEISAENWSQMFIPIGFAHGFCTLEPETEVNYKVSNFYSAPHEVGIRWNDPALQIAWPVAADQAVLSDKDRVLPLFKQIFGDRSLRAG